MDEELFLRLVQSFERIAEALGDICVIQKRRYDRDYPERREPRDAVLSRIKTEEDLAKERQGATNEPISEWLGGYEEPDFIGAREKAFLEEQRQRNASTQAEPQAGANEAGVKAARSKRRMSGKRASAQPID